MSRFALQPLRATLLLPALIVAVALGGLPPQPVLASEHTLTIGPSDAATTGQNSSNEGGPCGATLDGSVGYSHFTYQSFFGDFYTDCVYETAVRFDLSQLRQFHGAIITKATLTYTDSLAALLGPNSEPLADPYQLHDVAVWGPSCVYQLGVPSADWRGASGLIPQTSDDLLARVGLAQWDVTNQARRWHTYPDYQNSGLVFSGFDENGGFINKAWCESTLSNIQLQVDFVANDAAAPAPPPAPTPVPPPPPPSRLLQGIASGVLDTPPTLPDLLVANVEVKGKKAKQPNQCEAGENTITVTVGNVGYAPVDGFEVDLWVDGKPRGNKTAVGLDKGRELKVVFSNIKLDKGSRLIAVNLDPENKLTELDKNNNNYADTRPCS